MTITVKPSERPPVTRYVIRDQNGFYYTGHGQAPSESCPDGIGESGVPNFDTKNILFAIKYGDTESIDRLYKNFKIWCIERNRNELMDMFDKCDVLETYT